MIDNIGALPTLEMIVSAVGARRAWAVEALQKLIAIDSVAPAEQACQEVLADILLAEDLQPSLAPIDEVMLRSSPAFIEDHLPLANRPNLVCNYGHDGERTRSLILNSHIDTERWTQEADKWNVPPLSGTVMQERIYGRGAVDAKGQIMTAVLALLALKDLGYTPPGKVILQSVIGEEPSGNGTLALCERGLRADAAIVLEPTDGHIAYGHRGILGLRLRLQGAVAHAAFNSNENSIVSAGILASCLHEALAGWSSPVDAVYGSPTVNVGRIVGGESIFSRPHDCIIECGIRYAPGTHEQVLAHVLKNTETRFTTLDKQPWTKIEKHLFDHFDAGETPRDHPFVEGLLQAVQQVLPDRERTVFPGGCDARHFLNRSKIPTVVFGPGSLRQAHGINEYLSIHEWMSAAAALAEFVARWCR